ncbi:UNVERIFIED_CONTAM: hypothetical protein GTU68_042295 [Idotea baltica]|nr:hypothetical protein [Idotea baltica]
MGYGDLNCQNPNSKIPTPYLDELASQGMRFTDAHSSSGICSPSRFALLTGQYHWRRTHGIVGAFGPPMFEEGDITLPEELRKVGYKTACIGKWHLGWEWPFLNKPSGEREIWNKTRKVYLPEDIAWNQPIKGGPLERGFDYYFGDGTINFPPYAWVENDRVTEPPTEFMEFDEVGYDIPEGSWEFRPGPKVANWNPYNVLPTLTKKSIEWIKQQDELRPFFLYLALPSPHAPIIPNEEFVGQSEAGPYGDFVNQSDWVAGQVLKALEEKGLDKNTIVIFSADNGPEKYAFERAEKYDHFSMGDFRGLKRDVWEGGHHVPLIIKWPGKIKPASVSDEVVSQVDIMATISAILDIELPMEAAPDSYNLLSILKNEGISAPMRKATIHNTYEDQWAIRQGKWLYINKPTGGVTHMPQSFKDLRGYEDFETAGLLFDMEKDPEQRYNLYEQHPDKIRDMSALLTQYREQGYSVRR